MQAAGREGAPSRRGLATGLLAQLVVAVGRTSTRLGRGSGSTIGGRVGLALDRDLLAKLGRGRRTVLVSGTNGKTTTTRLLVTAAATAGEVATSSAGANMGAGLVSALARYPNAPTAVLEVDEAHLAAVAAALSPAAIVLLNLSRDQLDRTGEVRMLAERWRSALAASAAEIVANADDPLVVWAAQSAELLTWVATGGGWHDDAHHCPVCDARIEFSETAGGGWRCACGFARPDPDFLLDADGTLRTREGEAFRLDLQLPGAFNRQNAAMAAVAARALGFELGDALAAMRNVGEVEGRYAGHGVAGKAGRMLLAKNPAGWHELIGLVSPGTDPVVIGINARVADGLDPSWLWDVDFEALAGHAAFATGERRADLAVRLLHAGVAHRLDADPAQALATAPGERIDYVGNYTAFQDLRRSLATAVRPGTPPPAGEHEARPVVDTTQFRRGARTRDSALSVVVVHPDLLGTYGDSGNGRVLANRARWRDLDVELLLVPSDVPLPSSADLYCLGGGEDGPQIRAAERLADGALAAAVERGAVVLAVCAGFQILGHHFPGANGPVAGLGLLDVTTERGTPRAVGEVVVDAGGGSKASGFENHAGRTRRGPGQAPFGAVAIGVGNGDGSDGARTGRILGTYLHGPVLARNAWLADELLALATGRELAPLSDEEEAVLHRERLAAANGRIRGLR